MTEHNVAIVEIEVGIEELEQKVAPSGSLWPF
jgi:hypothetical protein